LFCLLALLSAQNIELPATQKIKARAIQEPEDGLKNIQMAC
jgi:hypothetical protein